MSAPQSDQPNAIISQLLIEDADLRDIVEEFVNELDDRLSEIKQAYEQLDWANLETLAHRLKGAGGSYGYPDISSVAADMEAAFRRQASDQFDNWMDQLKSLTSAAKKGLDEEPAA